MRFRLITLGYPCVLTAMYSLPVVINLSRPSVHSVCPEANVC